MLFARLKKTFFPKSSLIDSIYSILLQINSLESYFSALSDNALRSKSLEFKSRILRGEDLNHILPEVYSLVRETAKRVLNERAYDVQIFGAIVLHKGMIAEMKTGEGKTLVAAFPAFLNSLSGQSVHCVTVNDYLASRDAEWMGRIYKFHNLTVGCLTSDIPLAQRTNVYHSDVIYGTNNEFGFDYLRDHLRHDINHFVQKTLKYAIIDEVDSILIDEARTPLIISEGVLYDITGICYKIDSLVKSLSDFCYQIDEKNKNVLLTDYGIEHVEKLLKAAHFIEKNSSMYDLQNLSLLHYLNQSLKANKVFKVDVDYIVSRGMIYIIDEFTGRVMVGRRYSEGLHQAIEAKEKVKVCGDNETLASITFQNYFRMYDKISGMTGTAISEAQEFHDIYQLQCIEVPTNKKVVREDKCDVIYKTYYAKCLAIVDEVKNIHKTQRPILIGVPDIKKSEEISQLLTAANITHNILNAKCHEKEAEIIAQAGRLNSVTIATNIAGRGTDIKLGSSIESVAKNISPDSLQYQNLRKLVCLERKQVISQGGLYIIGTERHESRRIDDQLRGRSGRQGDPGTTKFFISLEDDLMRVFGSKTISSFLDNLGFADHDVIQHPWLNRAVEKAQYKVEKRNYEIRKTLLDFDNVIDEQRDYIYKQRIDIMKSTDFLSVSVNLFESYNKKLIKKSIYQNFLGERLLLYLQDCFSSIYCKNFAFSGLDIQDILKIINKYSSSVMKIKLKVMGKANFDRVMKYIYLSSLDFLWKHHISSLEGMKNEINLRVYSNREPINEYKIESLSLFKQMLTHLEKLVIFNIFSIKTSDFVSIPFRRNTLCPCGSNMKYKYCHGGILL